MSGRDRLLVLLTIVIAASPFLTPWQRDLFVGDETKYGRIIWELRQNHSLLVPTLEGRPYSHKPPLHFWMVYLLTYLFGMKSIWAFVLPSLIMFVLMLLLVARIARELFGGRGALAAFVFSTFYLAWGLAQTARMDMTFLFLTSYAALQLWRSRVPGSGSRVRHLLIAAVAVGVAILVKGPMAFVTIAVLILLEWIRTRRLGTRDSGPGTIPAKTYVIAAAIAAAIPLVWLIPALIAGGSDYSHELIVKQNIGRAVGAWVHREPPWWYLQRFPVTFFPWFFVVITALIALWRTRHSAPGTRHPALFCTNWILAVLIPYSILSSKLDVYMLSALVPAALLCAGFVEAPLEARAARLAVTGNRVILVLLAALFLTIVLLAPRFADQLPELELMEQPLVAGLFWSSAAVAMSALLFQIAGPGTRDPGPGTLYRSVIALGIAAIFPMIYLAAFLMPVVSDASSTRPLVNALRKQTDDGTRIGLWQAPHLWTSDMPSSYRHVEYLGRDRLRQPGEKPLVIATRTDRAHHLGRELLEQYRRVDQFRMRGKQFDVYRRR